VALGHQINDLVNELHCIPVACGKAIPAALCLTKTSTIWATCMHGPLEVRPMAGNLSSA